MPQFNYDTEAALIGAGLRSAKAFEAAKDIVTTDDFHAVHHQWAWDAMSALNSRGMGIDAVTVGDELERMGKLKDFFSPSKHLSGRAALAFLRDSGEPRNINSYAAEVVDYSGKRQLELICTQAVNWSQNGRRADEIMKDLTKRMEAVKVYDAVTVDHTQTLKDAISDSYDHTDRASRGEIVTLETGFPEIDAMLGGGLIAPDFMVIAGRPGDGKTALKVSIAKNVAEQGKRVAVFTLEMMNKQIAMRLIAMESGISYGRQKSGKLREQDWPVYTHAIEKLASKDYAIILNDLPAITIPAMRRELRRIAQDGPIDLVIIDYIQLQGVEDEHERRDLQIGEITRGIKTICKEFTLPVIAGAQMSRAVETRTDRRPMLADLRESGSIENDADIVAFIYKPDKMDDTKAELIFCKNRNGALGSVDLAFQPERTLFKSTSMKNFTPNERKDLQ